MPKKPTPEEIKRKLEDAGPLYEELRLSSDRACAILGGVFMDEYLGQLLRTYIVQDNPIVNALFTFGHSLDSFRQKIEMAYALGLLTHQEYTALDTIRTIRNDFAHSLHGLSFDSPTIADRCRPLNFVILEDPAPGWVPSPKEHFRLAVLLLEAELTRHISDIRTQNLGRTPWPQEETISANMEPYPIQRESPN